MIQATMVPYEQVKDVWPQVEKYMEGAAEYTHGRYDVDDILDSILQYEHVLWVAFDEERIKGVVVTNFAHYPKKKFVVVPFLGGVDFDEWKLPMLRLLQHWAFDNQCDGIEATARFGWAKKFKEDGHIELWRTFQLPAGTAGLGA